MIPEPRSSQQSKHIFPMECHINAIKGGKTHPALERVEMESLNFYCVRGTNVIYTKRTGPLARQLESTVFTPQDKIDQA